MMQFVKVAEALQVLENTAFAGGPFVEKFEKDFASFCNHHSVYFFCYCRLYSSYRRQADFCGYRRCWKSSANIEEDQQEDKRKGLKQ
jgi:hypothetical protein